MAKEWGEEELGLYHAHKHLAYEVLTLFSRQNFDYSEDILAYALIGLWHAIDNFDHTKGSFRQWAFLKMKRSAQDGLRELDYISRKSRSNIKHLAAVTNELAQKLGAEPTWTQLREHGVDVDSAVKAATFARPAEEHDWYKEATVPGPENYVLERETEQEFSHLITQLPPQMSIVVELMYYGQYNQAEVGEIMGLTYSRISQIHKDAMIRLRKMLSG